MRIVYARGLTGYPIRIAQGFGQWSHCGVVMPFGNVISMRIGHGAYSESMEDFERRYTSMEVLEKYTPNDAAGYAAAQLMLDQRWGYGYGELFNFITRKLGDFDAPQRAQCVEAVEICLAMAGRVGELARFEPWVRHAAITPQQSYIVR